MHFGKGRESCNADRFALSGEIEYYLVVVLTHHLTNSRLATGGLKYKPFGPSAEFGATHAGSSSSSFDLKPVINVRASWFTL